MNLILQEAEVPELPKHWVCFDGAPAFSGSKRLFILWVWEMQTVPIGRDRHHDIDHQREGHLCFQKQEVKKGAGWK